MAISERLPAIARTAMQINMAIGGATALLGSIFARPLLSIFITDQEVLHVAVELLRIVLWSGLLFGAFAALAAKRYDLILSNPPYVTAESMAILPAEYRHEPRLALAGGEDGLDFVHILLAQAAAHLTPQGLLVVEIGHNQYALEQAYPETSFIWLDTGYEEPSVFALARADLPSKTLTQGDFS